MNDGWELVIHAPTLNFLLSCRSSDRLRLLKFFDSLVGNPYVEGDYEETDLSGRRLKVRIVGNWAVTYWIDHAVKEVRIVRVQSA